MTCEMPVVRDLGKSARSAMLKLGRLERLGYRDRAGLVGKVGQGTAAVLSFMTLIFRTGRLWDPSMAETLANNAASGGGTLIVNAYFGDWNMPLVVQLA
jgi:hypothetical protein